MLGCLNLGVCSMKSSAIRVVARFKSKPGRSEELKNFLLALIPPTRREAGCLRYELHQNGGDPSDFVFLEEWESDAAIDAHMRSPHVQIALPRVGDFLSDPPDIRRYSLVRDHFTEG